MAHLSGKHEKILQDIFRRPASRAVKWRNVESLFKALGAKIEERAGSRVKIVLRGEVHIFHRPHPNPDTDKGALDSVRKWLESLAITPWTIL